MNWAIATDKHQRRATIKQFEARLVVFLAQHGCTLVKSADTDLGFKLGLQIKLPFTDYRAPVESKD